MKIYFDNWPSKLQQIYDHADFPTKAVTFAEFVKALETCIELQYGTLCTHTDDNEMVACESMVEFVRFLPLLHAYDYALTVTADGIINLHQYKNDTKIVWAFKRHEVFYKISRRDGIVYSVTSMGRITIRHDNDLKSIYNIVALFDKESKGERL